MTGNTFSSVPSLLPRPNLSIISTQLDLPICCSILTSLGEGRAAGKFLCKCNREKYAKPEIRAHFRVHFRRAGRKAGGQEGAAVRSSIKHGASTLDACGAILLQMFCKMLQAWEIKLSSLRSFAKM